MTIKQMHIELNQSLQKISANTTRKFLWEELDWVLNKIQLRFIQKRLRPDPRIKGKVSVDQLDADALRNIIVTSYDLETRVVNATRVKAVLPSDYMHLLSDASYIIKECDTPDTLESVSTPITYSIIKLTQSANVALPYYATASMTINAETVTLPSDLPNPSQYSGYKSKDDLTELIAYYTTIFASKNIPLYWEYCDGIYKPGCFIYVGVVSTLNWTVDSVTTNLLTTVMKTENVCLRNADYESFSSNRLETPEIIPDLLGTSFYTTSAETPISELNQNLLYIYKDKSFRISGAQINYVRKPRRMSLYLGVDCELAEEYHQTICDLSVEYIKGRMEDAQGQQLVLQDNENHLTL